MLNIPDSYPTLTMWIPTVDGMLSVISWKCMSPFCRSRQSLAAISPVIDFMSAIVASSVRIADRRLVPLDGVGPFSLTLRECIETRYMCMRVKNKDQIFK